MMVDSSYKNIKTNLWQVFFNISYIYFKHEVQIFNESIIVIMRDREHLGMVTDRVVEN